MDLMWCILDALRVREVQLAIYLSAAAFFSTSFPPFYLFSYSYISSLSVYPYAVVPLCIVLYLCVTIKHIMGQI